MKRKSLLKWHIEKYGSNAFAYKWLSIPINSNNAYKIKQYISYGYSIRYDDFLTLSDNLNYEYKQSYLKLLDMTAENMNITYREKYVNMTINEYKAFSNNLVKDIKNDDILKLLEAYYNYTGVSDGYFFNNKPAADDSIKWIHILNNTEPHIPRYIIDSYLVLNGFYKPNSKITIHDWHEGHYNTESYEPILYMVKYILKNYPEMIGSSNVSILREKYINEILNLS